MTARETTALMAAVLGAALVTFAAAGWWGWQGGCAAAGVVLLAAAVLLGSGTDTPTVPPEPLLDDAGQPVDPREMRAEGIGPGFR